MTQDTQETRSARFHQMALECAAMPAHAGMTKIDGSAVMAISSYARTLRDVSEPERLAVIGHAFDIYAAAVRCDAV